MSYTVKYTKPEKKEPVKYVLMQEEPKKIKVDVSNNKKNPLLCRWYMKILSYCFLVAPA